MAKKDLRQFDYRKVAQLDCEIWQAYYHHRFFKMFVLMIRLFKNQLGLNNFSALRSGYHFAIASVEYRLNKNHRQSSRIPKHLAHFYKIVSNHSTVPFDYIRAADLELRWWNIHRYGPTEGKELELGLARQMATVYGVSPESLLGYARYRALVTSLRKNYMHEQKMEPDWEKIKELLVKSWKSAHQAVQG